MFQIRHDARFVWVAILCAAMVGPTRLAAQDQVARRLASIVSVAMGEYGRAIDQRGTLISQEEYVESRDFLSDARGLADRLEGSYALAAQATLDTLVLMVNARRPPAVLKAVHARFVAILGSAGAMELPDAPLDTALGHQLFAANCVSCHGERGMGDGRLANGLSTPVPAIGSMHETPALTDTLAFNVMSVGVRGTAMPAFAATLTAQQRWNVVNYVYSLRGQTLSVPVPSNGAAPAADRTALAVVALLDSALAVVRSGDVAAAGDRAFDAYVAFEPLETPARARDPGLVASMERSFTDFRGAVRRGDVRSAGIARRDIADNLPRVVELVEDTAGGAWTAFWQSFLIILREGFEAILVIGAIVAFLIKTGYRERLRSIWIGVGLAIVASGGTAIAIRTIFSAIPASGEIVEAISLLLAVVVLFSVSYWLISKVEAAKWQQFISEQVSAAVEQRGGRALILVAFLAVYREGAETALFYQALFSQGGHVVLPLTLGMVVGSVALLAIFVLFYRFGMKIPMRPFFMVTSLLLYYMAFVFAGHGIRELQEGNVLPITRLPHVPHIDWLGLFPTVETVVVQGVLLALFLFAVVRTFMRQPAAAKP